VEISDVRFDLNPSITKWLWYLDKIKKGVLDEVDGQGFLRPGAIPEV
jgi:hypothetical protein